MPPTVDSSSHDLISRITSGDIDRQDLGGTLADPYLGRAKPIGITADHENLVAASHEDYGLSPLEAARTGPARVPGPLRVMR